MNFLLNKKPKPKFSLKSIENSNLFQRRVTSTTCHIDDYEISRETLIEYKLNNVVVNDDKSDKITNTTSPKNADNTPPIGTKIQNFSEMSGNQGIQLRKLIQIINCGSNSSLIRMSLTHLVDGEII